MIKTPDGRPLPSIGLSIGMDRLFAAMESVGKAPSIKTTTNVFVINFADSAIPEYLRLANELRRAGVAVEICSRPAKVAKQLRTVNGKGIPLVLIMGPDEMSQSQITLKDMRLGTESTRNREDVVTMVLEALKTTQ
jgi:histidyl-tRNA synthetase